MCLGECEIRSTMSRAFSLATSPVCLKGRPYWFARFSSSISSRCSWESAGRPAQCRGIMADIFISFLQQACVRGQTEGAGVISLDWMCCGGFARHRWTLCEHGHAVQTQVHVCVCKTLLAVSLKLFVETRIDRFACWACRPCIQCGGHTCLGWLKPTWTVHTFRRIFL